MLGLLVLAVVVKAHGGNLTLNFWLFLIPALAIYTFATLWEVPKLGRWFFRQFGHDESAEFIFVLATLFVVSFVAGRIEIEPIIEAFLTGIAITELIPQFSPLMNRIQFLLAAAETIAHVAACNVEPIGRVDDAIDRGITHTAAERNSTLIICGWKGDSTTRDNFLGSEAIARIHPDTSIRL